MLQINGKTFMNLQEAVQWLLDNNALPFQSSANYVANTEIGMGTIVNPSPAKVRIGSLIFFADSKVSTVVGLTENGFIVSDQYNDLVDDVVYVSNVQLNASGHLIVTLSNGDTIDAGLIKQVTGFSINASQHLIVSYNDSSTTDLGAIFNGNINISGTLNATKLTGDEIVETMTGYSFTKIEDKPWTPIYVGCCKNGNKITFVLFGSFVYTATIGDYLGLGNFTIPLSVLNKLYPYLSQLLSVRELDLVYDYFDVSKKGTMSCTKQVTSVRFELRDLNKSGLTINNSYYFRIEQTFLLSENLAS